MSSLLKAAVVALVGLSGSVMASTTVISEFDFAGSHNSFTSTPYGNGYDSGSNAWGNEFVAEFGDLEVYLSAWADTGHNGTVESAEIDYNSGGLLAYNRNPHDGHAIDNRNGRDMIFFRFTESVALTQINIGWRDIDSDIVIAGFNSLPSLDGNTWANIGATAKSAGNFVTALYDVATHSYTSFNSGNFEAKYWLIGAFNQFFSPHCYECRRDDIKIKGLFTSHTESHPNPPSQSVNAPLTLSLLGAALLFIYGRRQKS